MKRPTPRRCCPVKRVEHRLQEKRTVILTHLKETACVGLLSVAFHVGHAPFVPPYKREEHVPEQEPLRASDMGINMVVTAVTSGSTIQNGAIW
jgi:hypothetical protein